MIRINLLANAVSETVTPTVSKSTQKTGQILVVVSAVLALLIAIGVDYQITYSNANKVKKQLAEEQENKRKMEDLKKQVDEFEKKKELLENRLKIIKQLSAEQKGPVAVLSNINDRIPDGIALNNIKQQGNQITIEGTTNKKELVTQFAQQLEQYSNGLFTNIDPELDAPGNQEAGESQSIKFKISCNYNPPIANNTAVSSELPKPKQQ